jgi:glyoxylase-like metal-dependent hydrolase (beta-lactamase superfamily II)
MRYFSVVLFVWFTLTGSANAQSAREVFDDLMQKNGPWDQVKSVRFTTARKNHNKWQAYDFTKPNATNDEGVYVYDFNNKRYYTKTTSRYAGGYEFEFATIGKDTTRYLYDVNQSRNGRQLVKSGKAVFENSFAGIRNFIPFYALKAVKESGDSLEMIQTNRGTTIRRIQKNGSITSYHFGLDNLLKSIQSLSGGRALDQQFSDYTTTGNNLFYAQNLRTVFDNELTASDKITAIEINSPLDEALLQIPAEYNLVSGQPVKTEQIAKDVYLIQNIAGDRNIMFVNMDDYVFVTEAPLSSETTKAIADIIHKTIPGKPIRYVHLSHFHSDHVNGIRQFVAEGATIVTTDPTVAPIKTLTDDKSGRFNDSLSRKPQPAKFETFSKMKILQDVNHEIQIREIDNSHAKGMSFIYLPKEQIIYQGDLYSVPGDGVITPAIQVTKDFHRYLRKSKLPVKRIIGHHGSSNITPQMLEKAMSMKK